VQSPRSIVNHDFLDECLRCDLRVNEYTPQSPRRSDPIPRHQSRKARAAAIVFSYDYGHMFCVLDDVFAKSVTGITGNG
jgi:hypothetical protein